jgi:hypothetical protein
MHYAKFLFGSSSFAFLKLIFMVLADYAGFTSSHKQL